MYVCMHVYLFGVDLPVCHCKLYNTHAHQFSSILKKQVAVACNCKQHS